MHALRFIYHRFQVFHPFVEMTKPSMFLPHRGGLREGEGAQLQFSPKREFSACPGSLTHHVPRLLCQRSKHQSL